MAEKEYLTGTCLVCDILDGNKQKKEVGWCNTCQAHICKECEDNWIRRGAAFLEKLAKMVIK